MTISLSSPVSTSFNNLLNSLVTVTVKELKKKKNLTETILISFTAFRKTMFEKRCGPIGSCFFCVLIELLWKVL